MVKKESIKTTSHASNKNKISIVIHSDSKKKKKQKKRNKKGTSKGVSSTNPNQVPSVIISNTNPYPYPYSYPYPYPAPVSAPVSTYDAPPRYTEEQVRNARMQRFDNGLVQQALNNDNNETNHDSLVQEVISPTQEENPLLSQINQSNTTDAPYNAVFPVAEVENQSATDPPPYNAGSGLPVAEVENQSTTDPPPYNAGSGFPVAEAIYRTPKKRKINGDEQESSDVFAEIGVVSKGPNKGDLNLSSLKKGQLVVLANEKGINVDGLNVSDIKKKLNKAYKAFKGRKYKK